MQKVSHREFHFGWEKLPREPTSFRALFLICGMEIEKRLSVGEADSFPHKIEEWVAKEFQLPQTPRNRSLRILRTHIVR
jgi:hypothetical protein